MNMLYQQNYSKKQGTNPVEVNGKHVYPKNHQLWGNNKNIYVK